MIRIIIDIDHQKSIKIEMDDHHNITFNSERDSGKKLTDIDWRKVESLKAEHSKLPQRGNPELTSYSTTLPNSNPNVIGEKICAKCGKPFQPESNRQKYCSKKCGFIPQKQKLNKVENKKSSLTKKERICPKCKQPFIPSGNRQKYCSEKCGMKPKIYIKKEKREFAKSKPFSEYDQKPEHYDLNQNKNYIKWQYSTKRKSLNS